jgi:hypothetical protein
MQCTEKARQRGVESTTQLSGKATVARGETTQRAKKASTACHRAPSQRDRSADAISSVFQIKSWLFLAQLLNKSQQEVDRTVWLSLQNTTRSV